MVKVKIEGESEKINEFLNNLQELNFYFTTVAHGEENPDHTSIVISEIPGNIPDEAEFSFRGFLSQWIRKGLHSCLKDFLYISNNGTMVSFENMTEFRKIYDFLSANFGPDFEINQMLDKISENNLNNFEKSGLLVYVQDSDPEEEI